MTQKLLAQPKAALAMIFAGLLLAGLAGCATPIGADRVTARQSYRQDNESALSGGRLSSETQRVLHRYDLAKAFRHEPVAVLQMLHQRGARETRRDIVLALAELNYQQAWHLEQSVKPGAAKGAADFYLSASIYAFLYLFGEGAEPAPGPFDARRRLACDFYNRALARGLRVGPPTNAVIRLGSGTRRLLPGPMDLEFGQPCSRRELEDIREFLPAADYSVRGLSLRDRQSGLGAPLVAVEKSPKEERRARCIPATVFLRPSGDLRAWTAGRLTGSLELYWTVAETEVAVAGQAVPLETDFTSPLAYALNAPSVWKLGAAQFFSAEQRVKSDIYLTQPYEPGRVPVVFVHGTFSSPVWWGEMWNTLRADRLLRERCQFWYFVYNSGNPISLSAATLRAALANKVQELDPGGNDPALQRMVILGHSQGGLLAKLTAADVGDKLWRIVSEKDLDQIVASPELRGALQTNFFFPPLPCVQRVIFVATPHRGSHLATSTARKLARLFMRLPRNILYEPAHFLQLRQQLRLPPEVRAVVPTSLDGMSPKNRWLLTLAEIPLASGVKAHSIVALKGDDQPPEGGDGVVKYRSAHVDYVESELIVRSAHSCQDKPAAIEEARRILLEHLAAGAVSADHQ